MDRFARFAAMSCGWAAVALAADNQTLARRWLENAVLTLLDDEGTVLIYGDVPALLRELRARGYANVNGCRESRKVN
jgi:hypothetical protein